jgi:hypothetical protein
MLLYNRIYCDNESNDSLCFGINHICVVNEHYDIRVRSRNTRLIEGNTKCRHLNKLTCEGTSRQVFICLRSRIPYPPPLHTVYDTCIQYTVLLHTGNGRIRGGGGGVELEVKGRGATIYKAGSKIPT